LNQRELFLQHIAQTSPSPLAFEIAKAEGCLLYDVNGKEYIDLIGGISVATWDTGTKSNCSHKNNWMLTCM
jgi:4-aminobutyrate aminotransferase-like enzyme